MTTTLTKWINDGICLDDTLPYWDTISETLKGSQRSKARRFVNNGLVSYSFTEKTFTVKPIIGYNKTTYTIRNDTKGLRCNCQYYVKTEKYCSHILSILLWLNIERNTKKGM